MSHKFLLPFSRIQIFPLYHQVEVNIFNCYENLEKEFFCAKNLFCASERFGNCKYFNLDRSFLFIFFRKKYFRKNFRNFSSKKKFLFFFFFILLIFIIYYLLSLIIQYSYYSSINRTTANYLIRQIN